MDKVKVKDEAYIRELIPPSVLKITGDVKYVGYQPETYSLQFKPLENEKVRNLYLELEEQKCLIEVDPPYVNQIVEQIKSEEKYAKINIIHPDTIIIDANPLGKPPYKILNLVPQPLLNFNPAYNLDLTLYGRKGKRKKIKAIYFTVPVSSRGYQLGISFFSVSLDPKPVKIVYLYVVKNKLNKVLSWIKIYSISKCNLTEIENYYRIETQMSIS